jgi:hypothetical protein
MKVGDLVKTKVPGFGTGDKEKIGVIVNSVMFNTKSEEIGMVEVMHSCGKIITWYPWQLEITG